MDWLSVQGRAQPIYISWLILSADFAYRREMGIGVYVFDIQNENFLVLKNPVQKNVTF